MTINEDLMDPVERYALEQLSGRPLRRALALARAWCRASHLDEAASLLRPLTSGPPPASDPDLLRDLLGLEHSAPIPVVLDALAAASPGPATARRVSRAAELAWDAVLP